MQEIDDDPLSSARTALLDTCDTMLDHVREIIAEARSGSGRDSVAYADVRLRVARKAIEYNVSQYVDELREVAGLPPLDTPT